MQRLIKGLLLGLILLITAACAQQAPLVLPTLVKPSVLPSRTAVATVTPQPMATQPQATLTAVPTATPTPRLHTVALSETLLTIAWRYGVTLDALQSANPEIDPNILIVGQQIIIPAPAPTESAVNPTPTPLALTLTPPNCIADAGGGLWCLLSAANPQTGSENIAAEVRLFGSGSSESLNRLATAPLNRYLAGETMPLAVYFTPQELKDAPFQPPYQAEAVLVQALPLANTQERYLPLVLENQQTDLTPDGTGAQVNGELVLDAASPAPASRIWLVVALYGDRGQLLGFRRWESPQPLNPGERVSFHLELYSLDNTPIKSVVFLTEAVP